MIEKNYIKLFLLSSLLLLLMVGCTGKSPTTSQPIDLETARTRMLDADQKVILLGVDGLTWRKLNAYRKQGLMPNFDKLIESGASGKLESLNPMFSISLWTTIVTGVDYETHGVQYFYKFGNNGTMLPYTNLDRKEKALWNIMDDLDEPSGWVSWWGSWPAEPVKGFNISNYFIADFGFRDVEELSLYYPAEIGEDLQIIKNEYTSEWGETKLDPIIGDLSKINRENLKQDVWGEFKYGSLNWVYENNKNSFLYNFLRNDFRNDALAMNAGLQMMEKYNTRLTGIYLNGVDGVSHKFWKYDSVDKAIPPDVEVASDDQMMFGRVLSEYYMYQDDLLGQLLEKVDDKTTLMIVSDHGFQSVEKSNYISLNPLLHKLGFISFNDNGEKTDLKTSLVHEVTIKPWDQKRFIRINKKSNDFKDIDGTPLGAVKAGKEESKVRRELTGILRLLKLKKKNIPLFIDVRKPSPQEVNQNDGQGDIVAQLNREIFDSNFVDEIICPDGTTIPLNMVALRNYHSGNHDQFDSVIIVNGPLVKEGYKIKDARMYDLTPTVLAMLGLPVGDNMLENGKVLKGLFKEDFLEQFPVEIVISYGEYENFYLGTDISAKGVDEEIRDILKSIGYLQ